HELARLAIQESIPPQRRRELHRKVLALLAAQPAEMRDLEALAHHADSAGDAESVLRFAPQAAVHAAALGAHREAAGLYARALRYGDRLTPSERAELLELRAKECFFIDQYEEGIANLEEALQCRRQDGDRLR